MPTLTRVVLTIVLAAPVTPAPAAEDPVPIEVLAVADGISMLVGRGGNVGVSVGRDGVFVIDDQYDTQYEPITQALAGLSKQAPKFIINTHWHSDHAGSNAQMAASGAIIVAHDNVRRRLGSDQVIAFFNAPRPASPAAALPVVTFSRDLSFHFNGETIHVFHVKHAHTDGDAVVVFKNSNVIHTGDVFFNGFYPFIDAGSGGSIEGMIAAVETVLALCDDRTRIIPGHGPLSDKQGLIAYRDMLSGVRHAVANEMVAGHSVDEAVQNRPTTAFDATWGNGFIKPETFVRIVWDALTRSTLR